MSNSIALKIVALKQQKSIDLNSDGALNFLKKCKNLQDEIIKQDKPEAHLKEISQLTTSILHNTEIDQVFLKNYWLTNPSFQDLIISIDAFYSQNKRSVIDKKIVMIPFRKLIWDGDLDNALKLIDSTVASSRYLDFKQDQRVKSLLKYFVSCLGFIGGIEMFVRVLFNELAGSMTPIYFLILAYIGNMSFLASMAFSNRKNENLLRFDNGTFQKYWYQHADELQMLNRVVELDLKIKDKDQSGFVSKDIIDNLDKRKIVYNEPEQEIMLRQYWLSGGDGFVWVEPDQDPAELIWENHLKKLEKLK